MSGVEFTVDDVEGALESVFDNKKSLDLFFHDVFSDTTAVHAIADSILFFDKNTGQDPRKQSLLTRIEQGYLQAVKASCRHVRQTYGTIILLSSKQQKHDEIIQQITDALQGITPSSPESLSLLAKLKDLHEKEPLDFKREVRSLIDGYKTLDSLIPCGTVFERENVLAAYGNSLKKLDAAAAFQFYTLNRLFSKIPLSSAYLLEKDYELFLAQREFGAGFSFGRAPLPQMKMSTDYFEHVILPFLKNMFYHARNEQNNILKRDPKEEVYFSLSSTVDEDNKWVTYTFKDLGYGIHPNILPRIFEKGFSTRKEEDEIHGTGLFAVKEFVEQNGGTISVASELGQWTTFTFTVPYSKKEGLLFVQ